ncbi:MAG: efflux RND transporter periplasmic adaptor subunit [Tepidisphaeraceae bacterium]
MVRTMAALLCGAVAGAAATVFWERPSRLLVPLQQPLAMVAVANTTLHSTLIDRPAAPSTRPGPVAAPVNRPAPQPTTAGQISPPKTAARNTSGPQCIACLGTVASNLDVEIKSRATGEVVAIGPKECCGEFDLSAAVKKGDVLMQIDPADDSRGLQQAASQVAISQLRLDQSRQNLVVAQQELAQSREMADDNLASAEAQFQDARAKANRRKELLSMKLDTQEDYDTAVDAAAQAQNNLGNAKVAIEQLKTQEYMLSIKDQDVKLAEAQLRADQIGLDAANQRLAYCTVRAPIDGVVTSLSVEPGTVVFGGSTVMVLSDLSRIFVLAAVSEEDVGKVRVGQDAQIAATAYPGVHFTGKVVRIAAEGAATGPDVTFEVKIEVTDKNKSLLRPRMTANVTILRGR